MNQGNLYEALVEKDALDVFYQHLVALFQEMRFVMRAIETAYRLRRHKPDDRKRIEEAFQRGRVQVLNHRQTCKSLPPLPEFPQEDLNQPNWGDAEGHQS